MGREVRFAFKTEEEKREFEAYAEARGMTLSALAKAALYNYRASNAPVSHHPTKGCGELIFTTGQERRIVAFKGAKRGRKKAKHG